MLQGLSKHKPLGLIVQLVGCFSVLGSHMLSGRPECILVKWQHSSHTYELLPRLGAPVIESPVHQMALHTQRVTATIVSGCFLRQNSFCTFLLCSINDHIKNSNSRG